MPALRPAARCLLEQQGGQHIARVLRPAQRRHGLGMFMVERDRRADGIDDADRCLAHRAAAGGPGHGIALRGAEQESRVGSEYDVKQRVRPALGECGEIALRGSEAAQGLHVVCGGHRCQQSNQPLGAADQAFAFERGDHATGPLQRQLSRFQHARQFEAELEDRIEQRRFSRSQVQNP